MENKYLDYDVNNMFDVLKNMDKQLAHAISMGNQLENFKFKHEIKEIIVLGMGGSAIGGDLLRSYLMSSPETKHLRISVNRGYDIPEYADENTLIIASSYSGNTEETLSAFKQAIDKTRNIVVLASGGELAEIADKYKFYTIMLPKGFQPRAALGYSFMTLLYVVMKAGLLSEEHEELLKKAIEEAFRIVQSRAIDYADKSSDKNQAYELAKSIHGKIPVVYSSHERLDIVNLRWRGQFHENSKSLAFGNLLPEMNHNEINSWVMPEDMQDKFKIILLRDKQDNPRIKTRFEALRNLLEEQGHDVLTFRGSGNFQITRTFDLLYLGDWTSYYLAELYGQDTMAIPMIMKLKEILSK